MAPKPTAAQARLQHVLSSMQSKPAPEQIGTLKLGGVSVNVYESNDPARLAREGPSLLDWKKTPEIVDHLAWMAQKHLLGEPRRARRSAAGSQADTVSTQRSGHVPHRTTWTFRSSPCRHFRIPTQQAVRDRVTPCRHR